MRPLIAAGILLLLALPASARAGTVTPGPGRITYTGGATDEVIDAFAGDGGTIVFSSTGITGSCTVIETDQQACAFAPLVQFTMPALGGTLETVGLPATVSTLVVGSPAADTISDGPGNDTISGGASGDTWHAGAGADAFDGGDGSDTVDYSARSGPVTITVNGVADDGEAGEGDNVVNAEELYGGSGSDTLVAGVNGSRLHGGPGNDYLKGSPQEDRIEGDEGDDVIDSRDGVYDSIDCGPGTDTLYADPGDSATGCEIAPDRDGDGYLNEADCAPDNPAIHPGAGEIVGNDVDEDCAGGPAYFTVEAGITFSFAKKQHPKRLRFATLKLSSLEHGDRIALKCKGQGCPFKSRTLTASTSKRDLASLLKKRYLRPGATLEVRVTRPQHNGRVFRMKVTRKPIVTLTKLCLGPHSSTPGACT